MNAPNVVTMKLEGAVKSHARTDILARDVESVIDEPTVRGGTNLGLTPTETLFTVIWPRYSPSWPRIITLLWNSLNEDSPNWSLIGKDGYGSITNGKSELAQ